MDRTRSEFLVNILFLIFINLLIKPFYIFGIDRAVQIQVGKEQYGLYFFLFNFAFLFQIINDFGIQNYNNRHLAQYRHLLDKFLPNVLALKLVLGLIFFGALFGAAWLMQFPSQYYHLLLFLALNHFLNSYLLYVRSNISSLGFYRLDSMLSVLDKILLIPLCGFLLWSPLTRGQFRIEWFAYAQTLTVAITLALALAITWRRFRNRKFKVNRPLLVFLLRESWPYALSFFLMLLYSRVDTLMLERLLPKAAGTAEVGIYAGGFRLLDAFNMLGFLFSTLLIPMFSRQLKAGQDVKPLFMQSFQMVWAGAWSAVAAIFFFRTEIASWLYAPEADAYWGEVLGYLMLNFIPISLLYVMGPLLLAQGAVRDMNKLYAISVVVNITLNLLLIPPLKALGAAYATGLTQFGVLAAQWWLLKRQGLISIQAGGVLKLTAFVAVALLLGGAIHAYSLYHIQAWQLLFLICMVLCLLSGLLMGLIDRKELAALAGRLGKRGGD